MVKISSYKSRSFQKKSQIDHLDSSRKLFIDEFHNSRLLKNHLYGREFSKVASLKVATFAWNSSMKRNYNLKFYT